MLLDVWFFEASVGFRWLKREDQGQRCRSFKHHERPWPHGRFSAPQNCSGRNLPGAEPCLLPEVLTEQLKALLNQQHLNRVRPWKKPSRHTTRIWNSAHADAGGLRLTSLPSLLVLGLYTTDRAAADKRPRWQSYPRTFPGYLLLLNQTEPQCDKSERATIPWST